MNIVTEELGWHAESFMYGTWYKFEVFKIENVQAHLTPVRGTLINIICKSKLFTLQGDSWAYILTLNCRRLTD